MRILFSKDFFLNIYYFLFISTLIHLFVLNIINGYPKESWQITEFLINYQGGFVRRGLLGEIILYIYKVTGIQPYTFILLLSTSSYIMLIWFFLKNFIKKGYPLFILPFIIFLGNPIISDFWVRKDILIILIFIITIYFTTRKSNLYLILVNFFFIIGLLTHESIGFLGFPILLLILIDKNNNFLKTANSLINAIVISILQIAPSIIIFFCVIYFKGTQLISSQIWNSWKPITFPVQANDTSQIPAAIDALSWSLRKVLSFSLNTLKNFDNYIYAPLAWLIILVVIYYILTNTAKLNFKIINYKPLNNFNKINISNVLLFQLISVIPLFIFGWDYGRWVFYWIMSSFALILIVPEKELSVIFPKIIFSVSAKVNHTLDSIFSKTSVLLLCILIGFPAYSWSLNSFLYSKVEFSYLSRAIHKILHYFLLLFNEIRV